MWKVDKLASDEISSQTCVVFKYCEMSLMRDFAVVAFRFISLNVYTIYCVYCLLMTISALTCLHKRYMCCSERLKGAVQFDAISGD